MRTTKKNILPFLLFFALAAQAQQSDQDLARDAVTGWKYTTGAATAKAYKLFKSAVPPGGTYTAWQQQVTDELVKWVQQSYLPKGLVIRTIVKNDQRWYIADYPSLHSYGAQFLGYTAHFYKGSIDLKCCEQGERLDVSFNSFPGMEVKGFNPGGLYFFAERAAFTTGDEDAKLAAEGVDKKTQPGLYPYRTYLDHYHDNGAPFNKIGIVIPKNGEWPFKPVLVKDAVAYINQQLAAYPGILQKNPYSVKPVQDALERLKPYYNEVVKLKANISYDNALKDDNGHYLLDPASIINGNKGNRTFPEYNILVAATQQTIDQTKTDKPLWLYINLTPTAAVKDNPSKYDPASCTAEAHLVYSLLHNFNVDYISNWLAQPDKMKNSVYTPLNAIGSSTVKNVSPVQSNTPAVAGFETSDYTFKPLEKIKELPPVMYPAGFKSTVPAMPQSSGVAIAVLPAFKAPARSVMLSALPNGALNDAAFKKTIDDLKAVVSRKLDAGNVNKIEGWLKAKKIVSSKAIAAEAIGAWAKARPTLALYLFCKAVQADYNDMNTANNLAALLTAYGYAEKAIPVLQYVNNKANGAPAVLANMATAFYALGDMDNALSFAGKSIDKDSLNANANKVAAFVHLDKASQTNNKAGADKAIGCLKRSLKEQYDKEAADLLNKVEASHQRSGDYANTNFNEFPLLRRLELPAMPGDLAQARSFNLFLAREKSALSETADMIRAAYKKVPEPDTKQMMATLQQNPGQGMLMVKAAAILSQSAAWYLKMKGDLEQLFVQQKTELGTAYNKKINAITKKYADRLNKLEGGEGKGEEEEEMEHLKKARCEEYNKESATYLSDMARLANAFAQKSELVSRTYFRDYANWQPVQLNDNSSHSFLDAQLKYIVDVQKILSLYTVVEPCIYPSQPIKEDKAAAKPKQWDDRYCPAILNQNIKAGALSVQSNCTSFTVEGGEGFIGELNLNYHEDGTFKDITIGVGAGVEFGVGNAAASVSAGGSAKEYITISTSGNGPQVSDWGVKAGVTAAGNIGTASGDVNIASTNISVTGGVTAGGVVPDGLGLGK